MTRLRDAVPDDVERLAALARRGPVDADVSPRSLRDMVHDRTVVVAEREGGGVSDRGPDDGGEDGADRAAGDDVVGYVSYDVEDGVVVVHHLVAEVGAAVDGDDVLGALLDRALGFADREGLPVVVGLSPDEPAVATVEEAGFEPVERRRFGDDEVVRYERSARDER
jgi:hypothetical protein